MKRLPRSVIALGIVSLFTDFSSEMIYPLMPLFLTTVLGASGTFVGLVEGVAETTASFLKLASGRWADRAQRRKPIVLLGYGIASIVRPLVAVAEAPWHVLGIRFADRVGKGIRSSPRDAIIADTTPADRRGAAFGFHRAMDHTGALIGPLVAFALLRWAGLGYRAIFAFSAIPAVVAMVVLKAGVSEPAMATRAEASRPSLGGLPRGLRVYLGVVAVFTLASSTDQFLLLRAVDLGVPIAVAPLLWALLHAVKSTLSTPLGALSDRLPRRRVILAGWIVYAATYLGFAAARTPLHVWLLFAVYGAHFALTEGAEKALVADLAPEGSRGRAFGAFHFVVGILALPASLGFGVLWDRVGHGAAFVAAGLLAALAAGLLATLVRPRVTTG